MDIEAEIKQLLKDLGTSQMSSNAYDTAWVARLGEIDSDLSNQALEWLCENQLPDGSWGAPEPFYYHDRVICTLAAMIALTERGRRTRDKVQIEKGLLALERITSGATRGLAADPNGATVGFEMIVPTLVAKAEDLGIIKQQGDRILGRIKRQRKLKMEKLRGHKISRQWTTALSAEMAGEDSTELIDEQNIQEPNGSIGYSPSTTAYFLKFIQSNNALALEYLRASSRGGGFPFVTVFDLFERAWALWTLSLLLPHNSIPSELAVPHLEYLKRNWVKGLGISFTTNCILFDSDDTCVTFETLARFGYELDIEAVLNYEEKEHFRCYPLEINPSIGSNVHALGALRSAGFEKEHPSIKKILNFLRVTRHQGAFWFDKWHISPYYITPHVVMTCQGFDDELCSTAVDWILKTQNANGSWGFGAPTAEETAYCLIALSKWQEQGNKIPQGRIKQGALWLSKNLNPPYPWQWIGKSLYHPDLLIKSAILTALLLVER